MSIKIKWIKMSTILFKYTMHVRVEVHYFTWQDILPILYFRDHIIPEVIW